MKTFLEWLAMRREGLWLGDDKLAEPGMSDVSPLRQKKAAKPKPTQGQGSAKTLRGGGYARPSVTPVLPGVGQALAKPRATVKAVGAS